MKRFSVPKYRIPINGEWKLILDSKLRELEKTKLQVYNAYDMAIAEYQKNPLSFSLLHGCANNSPYSNDGLSCVNDYENDLILLTAPNQVGKEQPLDTPILTENGYVKMADIKVGDMVVGGDGKFYPVLDIVEHKNKQVYRITFDNDEVSTECGEEHLWKYLSHSRAYMSRESPKKKNSTFDKWEVVNLADIIKSQGVDGNPQKAGYIPVCKPVEFSKKDLPIPPYTLGCLIGDGSLKETTPKLTNADEGILERVRRELNGLAIVKYSRPLTYSIISIDGPLRNISTGRMMGGSNPIGNAVKTLGLNVRSEFKFIPEIYKHSSVQDRIDMLHGLMDTDGSGRKSRCEYYSISKRLAEDVAWIVRSLGGKAKISVKPAHYTKNGVRVICNDCYRVAVRLDIKPFYLKRKADSVWISYRRKSRVVRTITKSRITDCRCIMVGSPDGTYICNDFIVTHNSTTGVIYNLLRLLPCDPSWPCFQNHGVLYKEWEGPRILIAASYSWDKTRDLWEAYRSMIPRNEIGGYAPYWGHFEGERGLPKNMAFRYESKEVKLKCGSRIIFLCYQQSLAQWTGKQCDIAHLDEQCPETHFDELTARQLTRGSFTPIIMTLTGHVIPGRPDTGAAGWIKQKIVDQGITKGRSVAQYKIDIASTPDAIMSKGSKEKARIQWVEEPQKYKNEAKIREAQARYWGGWEVGGGIVLSEWNPAIHMIEPFDFKHWQPTYYRMIDHGQNPCACVLIAVMPWGDAVVYKEHYEFGLNIESNVVKILEMCGNTRRLIDTFEQGGMSWPVYEEVFTGTFFRSSELDSRSFAQKANESGRTLGSLYNQFGCQVSPACGDFDDRTIPLLKEWLAISKERKHINLRLKRKIDPEIEGMGAPKLYVFNTCTNLRKEIEGYIDKKSPCHTIDGCKYFTARDRPYLGDYRTDERVEEITSAEVVECEETGY